MLVRTVLPFKRTAESGDVNIDFLASLISQLAAAGADDDDEVSNSTSGQNVLFDNEELGWSEFFKIDFVSSFGFEEKSSVIFGERVRTYGTVSGPFKIGLT